MNKAELKLECIRIVSAKTQVHADIMAWSKEMYDWLVAEDISVLVPKKTDTFKPKSQSDR